MRRKCEIEAPGAWLLTPYCCEGFAGGPARARRLRTGRMRRVAASARCGCAATGAAGIATRGTPGRLVAQWPAAASSAPRRPGWSRDLIAPRHRCRCADRGWGGAQRRRARPATNDSTMQMFVSTIFFNDTEAHLREESYESNGSRAWLRAG